MKLPIGYNYFEAKQQNPTVLTWDSSRLINSHMLVIGSSGVGKSYTFRRLIEEAIKDGKARGKRVRFHVFDVHGDLHIPGASVVMFSEQAPYGLKPFWVNPDPDFGGVRKCINAFIRTVNQASSTALGVKQEAVLRNLLLDVFRDFGFLENEPSTWALNEYESCLVSGGNDNRLYLEVPFADKDKVQALGARWDAAKKHWWIHADKYKGDLLAWRPAHKPRTYPSLSDVLAYCQRLYEERFLGSDQKAVRALQVLNRKANTMQRQLYNLVKDRRFSEGHVPDTQELADAREEAIEAFVQYVNAIQTGVELETLMKYDAPEVLKSVGNRIHNLDGTGLFKGEMARFDEEADVWRYKLNALANEEKKMFVLFTMQDLFYRAVQRGEQDDVMEVIVLDELSTYTSSADSDNGDGIIGVIARQARKFGLALWAADQSPAGVPESLISSVGTKIILGIDEMYWQQSVTKLRIETKLLAWIQPHSTMAIQMKEKGSLKNRWHWVSFQSG